jgi:hypothetical protein
VTPPARWQNNSHQIRSILVATDAQVFHSHVLSVSRTYTCVTKAYYPELRFLFLSPPTTYRGKMKSDSHACIGIGLGSFGIQSCHTNNTNSAESYDLKVSGDTSTYRAPPPPGPIFDLNHRCEVSRYQMNLAINM